MVQGSLQSLQITGTSHASGLNSALDAEGAGFARAVVKNSASASSALCDPAVVVELVGARVSVGAGAPALLVSAILQALR